MPSQKKEGRKLNRRALPQLIDPALFRCIPVTIPDDPEWMALFVGAIDHLGKRSVWDYDPTTVADLKTVSDHWRAITNDVQQIILDGTSCEAATPTDPQDCTIISPVHASVGWYPNHPVHSPDGTGVEWQSPAWCTNCGIPGLSLDTDVLLTLGSLANFLDIFGLFEAGLPSFTLHFAGEGEIDLRFASTLLGGFAWVFPDGNPLVGVGVDLEWHDLGDFAGTGLIETFLGLLQGDLVQQTTVTHEVLFETPGSHTLTAWFFPKVDLDWPPLGWGGGLRSIQLCGDSIVLEDAPMSFDLTCAAGVIGLEVNDIEVSTVDLNACYPIVHPDWTLNRNNGDLQLLKDTVLHSSAVYPNYNTSYIKVTHLLQLFRDSVLVDTTPLPSYVLLKPEDDEIHLVRDGTETDSIIEDKFFTYRLQENADQHELTEDAAVVSSVTDDTSEAADVTIWHEKVWDFGVQEDEFSDRFSRVAGFGTYQENVGYVSEWDSGDQTQKLRVQMLPIDRETWVKIRLKVTASATVFDGNLTIQTSEGEDIFQFGATENFDGLEEREIERTVEFTYNNLEIITINYLELETGSNALFTITEIAIMALGYPAAPEDLFMSDSVIHNPLVEDFGL